MTSEELEKEAEKYAIVDLPDGYTKTDYRKKADWQKGAEFGYNKAKEEMQVQDYSMSYENGIFKCKYKSGKEFESVDGKTWKEILLPKESE